MELVIVAPVILGIALLALGISAVLQRRQSARLVKPTDLPRLEADIAALLQRGHRVQAVKLHRQRTGSSLRDANDAVINIGRRYEK